MDDTELRRLREAALVSMARKKSPVDELEELREAALISARQRVNSTENNANDDIWQRPKRKLESPPKHHSCTSPENGNVTPKMYAAGDNLTPPNPKCGTPNDSPPRSEASPAAPVFTVKVGSHMPIKRSLSKELSPVKAEDIVIDSEAISPQAQFEDYELVKKPSPKKITIKLLVDERRGEEVKAPLQSPSYSTVTSEGEMKSESEPEITKEKTPCLSENEIEKEKKPSKKSKKSKPGKTKHNKDKSSKRRDKEKEKKKKSEIEKINTSQDVNCEDKEDKENNHCHVSKKHKKSKHNNETEEKEKKKEDVEESPKNKKDVKELKEKPYDEEKKETKDDKSSKKKKDEKKEDLSVDEKREDVTDDSAEEPSIVSLKTKRQYEQMKSETNRTAPVKPKAQVKSKEKESRTSTKTKENGKSSSSKLEKKRSSKDASKEGKEKIKKGEDKIKINKKEERELLGEVKKKPKDKFESVMKDEVSSSEDEEEDEEASDNIDTLLKSNVDLSLDEIVMKPKVGEKRPREEKPDKKKKDKKEKKSKHKKKHKKSKDDDDKKSKSKSEKKKKRRKDSSSSESELNKKPKVKIDKAELNKIVQFLKQRDEAQRDTSANKGAFNPKIITKENKPIEIKLKTKPRR